MEIYPAIDIYRGKVVRLLKGDYGQCKVYSEDPAEVAQRWFNSGARWVHVVDLEGAKSGRLETLPVIQNVINRIKISVQFGGGVRSIEDAKKLLKLGVKRVIFGTKALDLNFIREASMVLTNKMAISLDVRDDQVQVEGWLKSGEKSVHELMKEITDYQLSCIIVTDIEKDGTLTGVNIEKVKRLLKDSSHPIVVSGGVRNIDDIRKLSKLAREFPSGKLDGVIIGKALYENQIDLREAMDGLAG